jgi:hypothetical protein
MDAENNRHKQDQDKEKEDKEMKAKRRYYGKVFVILIFLLITFEYYVYVYEILWKHLSSKYMLIPSRQHGTINPRTSSLPLTPLHDALVSYCNYEYPSWRDSFILGFLYRR